MKLKELLQNLEIISSYGSLDLNICDIIYDSRKVKKGCLFVCLKGSESDGHLFAAEAVLKGAEAVIVSEDIDSSTAATVVRVKNTREALALLSAAFFGHPANHIKTIGITGTKGKTTSSFMIRAILEKSGIKTGIIGTLGVVLGDSVTALNNTTPESYEVQKYLRKMVEDGYRCAVMEVSSLGLKCNRVDGFVFDCGVFTNFSPDHIGGNEHETLDEYLQCKSMLFRHCRTGVLNADDLNLNAILYGHSCRVITFGFSQSTNFIASKAQLKSSPGYLGVSFELSGEQNISNVQIGVPGKFNVYNALAAIAVCTDLFNVSCEAIIRGLKETKVKGRMEPVPVPFPFTMLIDYAHNALSMHSLLSTLREYNPKRLVVVFGAGGNRPKARRYEMGETAGNLADFCILTEDNSRDEDVFDIIDDIRVGLHKTKGDYITLPKRRDAIRYCIETAEEGDVIVLAGKGHEDYLEIKGVKHHFDEREAVAEIIKDADK